MGKVRTADWNEREAHCLASCAAFQTGHKHTVWMVYTNYKLC